LSLGYCRDLYRQTKLVWKQALEAQLEWEQDRDPIQTLERPLRAWIGCEKPGISFMLVPYLD
jgi:hypothetical protein